MKKTVPEGHTELKKEVSEMNMAGDIMIFGPSENRRLTVHFEVDEFRCPCCGVAIVTRPLLRQLELLREKVGEPIRVTSGYRCPKHNAEVGGSETSLHMAGCAVDIVVDGMDMRKLARLAGECWFEGILVYEDHVHLDTRSDPYVRLDPPGSGR